MESKILGKISTVDRIIGTATAIFIPYVYVTLFSTKMSSVPFIAGLLGFVNPMAGFITSLLIVMFLLYTYLPFLAFILSPALLFLLAKGIKSWRNAAILAITVPLSIMFPKFLPVFLAFALASSIFENEIDAFISGIIYFFLLIIISAILLPSDLVLSNIIYVPGGFIDKLTSTTYPGKAGEFYYLFVQRLISDNLLIEELILVVLAFFASSITKQNLGEKYVGIISPLPIILNSFIVNNMLTTTQLFQMMMLTFSTTGLTFAVLLKNKSLVKKNIEKRELIKKQYTLLTPRYSMKNVDQTANIVDIVFSDVSDTISLLQKFAEKGEKVIILAPSLEDELLFIKYALKDKKELFIRTIPAHRLKDNKQQIGVRYVIYIPPLSKNERLSIFKSLSAYYGVNIDEVLLEILAENTENFSRTRLLLIMNKIRQKIKETRDAITTVLEVLSEVYPDISPEFYEMLEKYYEKYYIIGIKN
ncbi:MAG: hypothetical protein DRJ35_02410 [Thermoprotei archaeon]|nr:MAG: hypothetical protein DRJ35_02410 [Thermoprotei archaeon]